MERVIKSVLILSLCSLFYACNKKQPTETVNNPPNEPVYLQCIDSGKLDTTYNIIVSATDPEGKNVAVRASWGNGDTSAWSSWVPSGTSVVFPYSWTSNGIFEISFQTKQEDGITSYWGSYHFVTISNLKWAFRTGGEIISSPAIGPDGTVYFTSKDGYLYALAPDSTMKWSYYATGTMGASPVIASDGTIYFSPGSPDTFLYALNSIGTLKWRVGVGNIEFTPALGSDGTIYVGTGMSRFYAIDQNGNKKWSYYSPYTIWTTPVVGTDGTIYVKCSDDYLYAIEPSGSMKWKNKIGGYTLSIGSDGTIFSGSVAINQDGTIKWYFESGVGGAPVIGEGGVMYGCQFAGLMSFNFDGTLKWSYLMENALGTTPAICDSGMIYFGSEDRYIYCINSDGKLKWRFGGDYQLYSYDASPTIDATGTIYIGGQSGIFYALQGSGKLANSAWPMYQHDIRHTGCAGAK